jgi:hypothetical protein
MQQPYQLILIIIPHPNAGPIESPRKLLNCPSWKAEASCHGDMFCFPNCLAASDKHKKLSQMDTDLRRESRDFLTPRFRKLSKEGLGSLKQGDEQPGLEGLPAGVRGRRTLFRCLQTPTP